jgi:hypothetical protein
VKGGASALPFFVPLARTPRRAQGKTACVCRERWLSGWGVSVPLRRFGALVGGRHTLSDFPGFRWFGWGVCFFGGAVFVVLVRVCGAGSVVLEVRGGYWLRGLGVAVVGGCWWGVTFRGFYSEVGSLTLTKGPVDPFGNGERGACKPLSVSRCQVGSLVRVFPELALLPNTETMNAARPRRLPPVLASTPFPSEQSAVEIRGRP